MVAGQAFAEFAPQLADMAVDGAVGHHPVVGVDHVHQLVAGPDAPGLAGQRRQQLEFDRGERHPGAVVDRLEAVPVQGQAALGRGLGGVTGAAQHRLDPRHHFPGAERLADVVVGADLQAQQAVHLFHPGGDHQNRHLRETADRLAHFHAVAVGQHQVEQHGVEVAVAHALLGVGGAAGLLRLEMAVAQIVRQQLRQPGLILDDQNFRHALFLPFSVGAGLWERALPAKGWLIATRQDPRALSNSGTNSLSGILPGASLPFAGEARSYNGNRTVILRPPRGLWSASIVPPCASTIRRAMASPRPAPPVWRLRELSTR